MNIFENSVLKPVENPAIKKEEPITGGKNKKNEYCNGWWNF
ncbi:MAG: hypothetical protein US57_C0024G0005 [Candidatus Moranbacteria bacterium GW2011_GWC2_37_73]|nr:MAG: hypothetical protein US57_C0024G0005 [Candidatus Moranbacteria bacterium GW2011_GWC2_37_73]